MGTTLNTEWPGTTICGDVREICVHYGNQLLLTHGLTGRIGVGPINSYPSPASSNPKRTMNLGL